MNLLPDEKTTKDTYNKVASIWVNSYNTEGFWKEQLEKYHELLPKGKVLEIGAGGTRDAKALILAGYEYVGTDVSERLLEICRKEIPNARFLKQSVYDLNFDEKFDGFWASKVLLHLPKSRIDEALQRIKSVIKDNGIGFISLIDGKGEGLEDEKWDDGSHHKRYFAYYSKEEFNNVLKHNSFELLAYSFKLETGRLRWHCFFVKKR